LIPYFHYVKCKYDSFYHKDGIIIALNKARGSRK